MMVATLSTKPLRAVVYARISREEEAAGTGVESTQIQVRDGRAAIDADGWIEVAEPLVDRGISGAEFQKRTKLRELLALAKKGAFDVVVVRDQKRIGRDAARAVHALVELDNAGVRVWYYQQRKFAELGGTEFIVTAADGYAAENERKSNNANIKRALRERAASGLATGARIFGYTSVPIEGARPNKNGHLPKKLEIDAEQAAVIIRVGEEFVRCGGSYRATAHALNEAGVRSSTQGLWFHKLVRAVLQRPQYRGYITYAKCHTRYRGGTAIREVAPAADVIRVDRPDLMLWPPDLLRKIDALMARVRPSHSPQARTRHLASSLVGCSVCGSGLACVGSTKGSFTYVCGRHMQHGRHACKGIGYRSEKRVDEALARIAKSMVTGRIAEKAWTIVERRLLQAARADTRADERKRLVRELAEAEREKTHLAKAIAKRGDLDALLSELDEATKRATSLQGQLARLDAAPVNLDPHRALRDAKARVAELRDADPRVILAAALRRRRFVAMPIPVDGQKRWHLSIELDAGYLFAITGEADDPKSGPSSSASTPWCRAPCASPWPSWLRRP